MSNIDEVIEYLTGNPSYISKPSTVIKKFGCEKEDFVAARDKVFAKIKSPDAAPSTPASPASPQQNLNGTGGLDVNQLTRLITAESEAKTLKEAYRQCREDLKEKEETITRQRKQLDDKDELIRSLEHSLEDTQREHQQQLDGINKKPALERMATKLLEDPEQAISMASLAYQQFSTPKEMAYANMWLRSNVQENPAKVRFLEQLLQGGYIDNMYSEHISANNNNDQTE